jgi:hypothetical protein
VANEVGRGGGALETINVVERDRVAGIAAWLVEGAARERGLMDRREDGMAADLDLSQ